MGSDLTIRNTQSPGDIIVLSAAVRDLALRHPGKYDVSMCVSKGAEVAYTANPHVKRSYHSGAQKNKKKPFVAHYPLIKQSNQQRKHFLWGFIEYMNAKLKTDIRLTEFRPDIHLTPEEMAIPLIDPPYWVFLSGGKTDFPTKIWSRKHWQSLITQTQGDIRWVQCGGGSKNHIFHEQLDGVYSYMVKKTGLRDFMRLIYHADGVACVVTAAMHIAAAFNKPCVVIAGGREPWWWEAYNNENRLTNMRFGQPTWQIPANDTYVEHAFIHTMNKLACCKGKGCWKSKLAGKSGSKCTDIVEIAGQKMPRCKAMITPEHVIHHIQQYYKNDMIIKPRTVVPVEKLSTVYCLHGMDESWVHTIKTKLPDKSKLVATAGNRMGAIRRAIDLKTDWIFWFEPGSMPTSVDWLQTMKRALCISTVKGKMYRTREGKFYPHPNCFIAPTKLLNKDATTFEELFNALNEGQFSELPDDIVIKQERPCTLLSTDQPNEGRA